MGLERDSSYEVTAVTSQVADFNRCICPNSELIEDATLTKVKQTLIIRLIL